MKAPLSLAPLLFGLLAVLLVPAAEAQAPHALSVPFPASVATTRPALLETPSGGGTPDTTDWRAYFPLAVGNAWEYQDAEALGIFNRYDLEADTTVNGWQYFRRAHRFESVGDTIQWTTRDYVRYDTSGVVVAVPSPTADTVAVDPCGGNYFAGDLRIGFGARVACPSPPPDSVFVDGEYGVVWVAPDGTPLDVAAVKTFLFDGLYFVRFVADIGPVSAGNLWGPRLHYVRVGGVEYGTPQIVVSAEPPSPPASGLTVRVLGNPARGPVAFALRAERPQHAHLEVFDVLGRRVWAVPVALSASERRVDVPASALGASQYVVRVSGQGGAVAHPFTVVR